ncbi:MAG: NADH-quinone oxidoreductase subunit C [Candidatus Omnitrophica bacterium]|nr:NADH-quinone oxidoreductase subunit C [Candidatus Omnitrophota bacterium]
MTKTKEESLQGELIKNFRFLDGKITVSRPRRMSAEVPPANFREVLEYAVDKLSFTMLCAITGLDETANLAFIYHIAREDGIILNIKVAVDRNNPAIETITGLFPGADVYERELVDLLGAKVEGLAKGSRYPLTDDWPAGEYPLRKDWKKNDTKEVTNA